MKTLGKYKIQEEIGSGGFGRVYCAIDTSLDGEVALKILHPQLTVDAYFLEKFRDEAKLVATLDNPHIVTIYEFDEADGYIFIAMRYMGGGSLKNQIDKDREAGKGPMPYEETLQILKQICEGLQVAHDHGLVHRDIKPGNILFDAKGNAVLSDFGLAKVVQETSLKDPDSLGGIGTPAYKAPELWEGPIPPSRATDIYSLGCVLSEMLTGKVLFDGETSEKVITQHLVRGAQILDHFPIEVPEKIQDVLEKALAKNPADRYQTADEFMEALDDLGGKIGHPDGFIEHPIPKIVWIVGSVALLIAAIVFWRRDELGQGGQTATRTAVESAVEVERTRIEASEVAVEAMLAPILDLDIGSTMVSPKDGMVIVYVPEGDFMMGSDDGQNDEKPEHEVYLDAYWIDQTEVTNAMFAECVAEGVCKEPSEFSSFSRDFYYGNNAYDEYPVNYVNWFQARSYCEWAGRRLPTEAEWEKAARGEDGRTYPWDNGSPGSDLLNYNSNINDTTSVGLYSEGASPYGALDMAGNVWEWVSDYYSGDYYESSPEKNPTGPEDGDDRVIRGGSWDCYEGLVRSASRYYVNPDDAYYDVGFRCALSAASS